MVDPALKDLEAKCHCGSVHFTISVARASLPLQVHLCHCSICRYQSGAPAIFHAHLPNGAEPKFIAPSSESNLTMYVGEGRISSWNFCSTCGCHVSCVGLQGGNIAISTSIFADHAPENFQIRRHIYNQSAKDGGIATMLTHIEGREFQHWNPPPEDERGSKIVECQPEVDVDGQQRLRAQCYCGGVSFTIKRPDQGVLNDSFMSTFVSPLDKMKWSATLDICDDCRLVTGTHVIGWMFVPLKLCEPAIGPDLLIGTAKTYASSPGALRSFCGACGATVFFSCDDRHVGQDSQVVDVAAALLRAPEGPMAENWLTWRSRIAFEDSGKRFDAGFAKALGEGSKDWVVKRCGRELTYSIG